MGLYQKHGLSKHPLHRVWRGLKERCYNINHEAYNNYGGRGIRVSEEWLNDFKVFYDWCIDNGYEKGLQVDRIDNDERYSPKNCRLVTPRKNSLNRRKRSTNTTGYVGIYPVKKKFASSIYVKGKSYYLGSFETVEYAVEARNKFIIKNNLQHEYDIQEYEDKNNGIISETQTDSNCRASRAN